MNKFTYIAGAWLLLSAGCTTEVDEADPACSADADGDGLDDCAEEELGTDPASDDSDDDGFTDAEELDCVSDPLDADEQCYACGWEHNDPGDLVSEGRRKGDIMDSAELVDQCGDMVDLWDFHGEYHVLYLTAAW
jgi:hypothetical protein